MSAPSPVDYRPLHNAEKHTCWDQPGWDGLLAATGECRGCDQAKKHPCRYCGYGDAFTTHNDIAHHENGDPQVPEVPGEQWHDAPHVYLTVDAGAGAGG